MSMLSRSSADHLKRLAPLGQVLHIGAGFGIQVPAYLAAGARRITLVEPEPECRPHLAALAVAHEEVDLVTAAAVASPAQARGMLNRYSYGALNSLKPGKGLEALFPGLARREQQEVDLRDVTELASGLENGPNVLVVEACGMALDLIRALHENDLLERFQLVQVQETRTGLYEDGAPLSEVQAYLAAQGFDLDPQLGGEDPEFPVLSVRANETLTGQVSKRRYLVKEQALADLSAEFAAYRESAEEEKAALTLRLDESDKAREAAVSKAREDLTREIEELRDSHTRQAEENDKARNDLEAEKAQLQQEIERLKTKDRQTREELSRTHGQISLIRDMLLQGQGL